MTRLRRRKGHHFLDRQFNLYRHMQLAVFTMISPKIDQNAKEKLSDFLTVYSKKFFIKVKFKVFFERLIKIQTRIKSYLDGMKNRI